MSTRGTIAFGTDEWEWEGRYHHWDSYPSGLGRTLWHLYHGHFDRNLDAMKRVLFDEHPAGWSSIVDADFTLTPGYTDRYDAPQPRCYCHGERREPEWTLRAGEPFEEWAYILTNDARLLVLADGRGQVAEIDLNGPEPDWKRIG